MTVRVRLVCSDGGCAALYEAWCSSREVETLACECGCALQVLGWPAAAEPGGRSAPVLDALHR